MPRKKPSILSIEEPKTLVDVTIKESNLPGSNGKQHLYGSIEHKKITVRQILGEIEKNHSTLLTKELMFYIAQELSLRMMDKFKKGYAVELLDFGTIFPTMKGSLSRTDTPGTLKKHFDVGFTPSKEAKEALKNYEVRKVHNVSLQHWISNIKDMFSKANPKNNIVAGNMAQIKGKAIKLGGKICGLYAAPIEENWSGILPDRKDWIQIKNITTNMPSTLEFFVDGLTSGHYIFIVETSLSAGGKELKNSVTVLSPEVQVLERE